MSIMSLAHDPIGLQGEDARNLLLDNGVRDLLDHIAVELAAEYVRPMEIAASTEAPSPTDHRDT